MLLRSTPVDGKEGEGEKEAELSRSKVSLQQKSQLGPYQEVWREGEPSGFTRVLCIIGCAPPPKAMSSGAKWTSLAEATCKGG